MTRPRRTEAKADDMTEQPAKPTPGPWRVELMKRTTGWLIHGPQGESITDGPIWTESFAAESKANAYLIAGAPETAAERDKLLDVLELALSAIDNSLRSAGPSTAGFIATRKLMALAQTQGRAVLDEARKS